MPTNAVALGHNQPYLVSYRKIYDEIRLSRSFDNITLNVFGRLYSYIE